MIESVGRRTPVLEDMIPHTFRPLERVAAVLTIEGSHFPVLQTLVSPKARTFLV
jgi:tryptophan 2,3-dioxygenase